VSSTGLVFVFSWYSAGGPVGFRVAFCTAAIGELSGVPSKVRVRELQSRGLLKSVPAESPSLQRLQGESVGLEAFLAVLPGLVRAQRLPMCCSKGAIVGYRIGSVV
jgi:hypothetical protein